ncbi:MAG: hypothetical protein H6R26_996, partial [Proteobacteria bacterium]|nr:hypothetical protein [Pseudomonadota bacterium]
MTMSAASNVTLRISAGVAPALRTPASACHGKPGNPLRRLLPWLFCLPLLGTSPVWADWAGFARFSA